MTTSANVTAYIVYKDGKVVGRHHQNHLCKYAYHELLKYENPEEYTIRAFWDDEEEETHEYEEMTLVDFLTPYFDMGRRYRDGCTIEEVFNAPRGEWGLPDLNFVKANRRLDV